MLLAVDLTVMVKSRMSTRVLFPVTGLFALLEIFLRR